MRRVTHTFRFAMRGSDLAVGGIVETDISTFGVSTNASGKIQLQFEYGISREGLKVGMC
jgi:hypothetical protein